MQDPENDGTNRNGWKMQPANDSHTELYPPKTVSEIKKNRNTTEN